MATVSQRYPIAFLGWLSTVAMSLSFLPALDDHRYVVVGALVAGGVVSTGVVLRLLRTPTLLVLAVQLLVLVEGLLLAFGSDHKYAVLPTRKTLASIEDLVHGGFDVAQKYAAPAPSDAGLLLMVVFLIGLVAVFVDLLAVGIGRVPLAGLPLLALYTVPVAALPKGVPFYTFVPGAACYIATLAADERDRLAHWGRLVTRDQFERSRAVDLSALRDSGRRIGVVALLAAVLLPVFIPAFSASILDGNRHAGLGGSGNGPTLSFQDPMVSLAESLQRRDPVDLIEVGGDVAPQYLRLTVLDKPGPNAWSAEPVSISETVSLRSTLPSPTGLSDAVPRVPHTMTVALAHAFPSDSAWLPVPFDAQVVDAGSEFGYVPTDQTVSVTTDSALGDLQTYDVSYSVVDPTSDQLRDSPGAPADIMRRYGEVPAGVPQIVAETANTVTAGAHSQYERALLLQSFFRDHDAFTYDLTAGYGYGYDAMQDFLLQRRGFCQHFAATMAMMARTLGIPSRVVVGFLQSDHTNSDGQYVITSHNVHAWPELYFENVGWVRFEPTPGVDAPFPSYAPQTIAPDPPTSQPGGPTSLRDPLDSRNPGSVGASAAPASSGSDGSGPAGALPSTRWLVLIGLALVALLPGLLRWGLRRSRMNRPVDTAAAAEAAWTELRDFMVDLRMPWTGSMTPRARERAVGQYLGDDQAGISALHRLALSVERARYAASPPDDASATADLREVTAALSRRVTRSRRIRAALAPASLLPDLRGSVDDVRARFTRPGSLRAGDGGSRA